MKKTNILLGALCTALLVFGVVTSGGADSFVYDLNYQIDGGPPVTYIGSLGKVTIADDNDPSYVKVTIDLNDGLNIQAFRLNFYMDTAPAGLSISPENITADINKIKADGYAGFFDFEVPSNGNLNGDPWVGTLSATGNLDASFFNALDTLGNFHVAVHIGEGEAGLPGQVNSLWAGDGTTPIPEPGTLLLLGLGLVGLAGLRRKF